MVCNFDFPIRLSVNNIVKILNIIFLTLHGISKRRVFYRIHTVIRSRCYVILGLWYSVLFMVSYQRPVHLLGAICRINFYSFDTYYSWRSSLIINFVSGYMRKWQASRNIFDKLIVHMYLYG